MMSTRSGDPISFKNERTPERTVRQTSRRGLVRFRLAARIAYGW